MIQLTDADGKPLKKNIVKRNLISLHLNIISLIDQN